MNTLHDILNRHTKWSMLIRNCFEKYWSTHCSVPKIERVESLLWIPLVTTLVLSIVLTWYLTHTSSVSRKQKNKLIVALRILVPFFSVISAYYTYVFFWHWQSNQLAADAFSTLIKVCASAGAMSAAMFATSWSAGKEHAYGISYTVLLRNITIAVRVVLLLMPVVMAAYLPAHLIAVRDDSGVQANYALFPSIFYSLLLLEVSAIVTAAFFPLFLSAPYLATRAEKKMKGFLSEDLSEGTDFWQGHMDAALVHAIGGETKTLAFFIDQIWRWAKEVEDTLLGSKTEVTQVEKETVRRQLHSVFLWCSRLMDCESKTQQECRHILQMFIDASRGGGKRNRRVRLSIVAFLLFYPIVPVADRDSIPEAYRIMLFITDAINESILFNSKKHVLLWQAMRWHLRDYWQLPEKDIVRLMGELHTEKISCTLDRIHPSLEWLIPAFNALDGKWKVGLQAPAGDSMLLSDYDRLSIWV